MQCVKNQLQLKFRKFRVGVFASHYLIHSWRYMWGRVQWEERSNLWHWWYHKATSPALYVLYSVHTCMYEGKYIYSLGCRVVWCFLKMVIYSLLHSTNINWNIVFFLTRTLCATINIIARKHCSEFPTQLTNVYVNIVTKH